MAAVEPIPPLRRDVKGNAQKLLSQLGANQESATALALVVTALKAEWVDGWLTSRHLDRLAVNADPEASSACPRCGGYHARMGA